MRLLYGYPLLPQAGLGNMLIPWADCLLWCKDNNAQMISPRWLKLRLGPLLRRERDKRLYHRCFVSTGIAGLQRLVLLAICRRVAIEDWRAGSISRTLPNQPTIVVFRKYNVFENLIGRQGEVRLALYQMVKPYYRPPDLTREGPFIGIHVRLGDYPNQSAEHSVAYRLPMEWYTRCLTEIRRVMDKQLRAIVFSDGSDAELAPLLDMPDVVRSPFREAITDMLALAQASLLITSRSTFSLWSAYLGQMPSIWYPPKSDICRIPILSDEHTQGLEIEWKMDAPLPSSFVDALRAWMKK